MPLLGLIIAPMADESSTVEFAVFTQKSMPLLFIRKPAPINWRALSKEQRKIVEKEERKKQIQFGDWISFLEANVKSGFIEAYEKVYALCESRVNGEHLQIESVCAISPGYPRFCYSSMFGNVNITPEEADRFLPDVAVRCWINVSIDRLISLKVAFGDFIDVSDDQDYVSTLPWNRQDRRFIPAVKDESDGEEDFLTASQCVSEYLIGNEQGTMISERAIYSYRHSDAPIQIAYVSPTKKANIGDCVIFEAFYSLPLRTYVVTNYRVVWDAPNLKFTPVLREFKSTALFEISVRWDDDLPFGYFRTERNDLGIVNDPEGLLLPFILDISAAHSPLTVTVIDSGPGAFCHFVVTDLTEQTKKKLQEIVEKGYEPLKGKGFLIDDGLVFTPKYGPLKIRFSKDANPEYKDLLPGTWITFKAESLAGPKPNFLVKEWKKSFEGALQPIEYVHTESGNAYKVACVFDTDLRVMRSGTFGFIHDPEGIVKPAMKKKGTPAILWVKLGKCGSRSRFIVSSIEKPEASADRSAEVSESVAGFNEDRTTVNENAVEYETAQVAADQITKPTTERPIIVANEQKSERFCVGENCLGEEILRRFLNDQETVIGILSIPDGPGDILSRAAMLCSGVNDS